MCGREYRRHVPGSTAGWWERLCTDRARLSIILERGAHADSISGAGAPPPATFTLVAAMAGGRRAALRYTHAW